MDTGIPVSDTPQAPVLNPGLELAIQRARGQNNLARAIGRRQASVWSWQRETGKVSAEDAVAIEKVTAVPAELICPALAEYAVLRGLPVRNAA